MDFLNPEIRNYFFKQYPDIYSKVDDLPPAKYNVGSLVKNSLVSSGCIINGTVELPLFSRSTILEITVYIKNSIILNDVYILGTTPILKTVLWKAGIRSVRTPIMQVQTASKL